MNCYLCKSEKNAKVKGSVRDMPNLQILKCQECGLVFLNSFDHIYDSFYEESKMLEDLTSVESWRRETESDDMRRFNSIRNEICNKDILDFGTGNGQFLKIASAIARSVVGVELDARASNFLNKEGIKCHRTLDDISRDEKFDIVFVFHVLEHLKDPIAFLIEIASKVRSGGKIILEVPNADDALISVYKSNAFSDFTYWSCHLMLFNDATLRKVIEFAGLKCKEIRQVQRYPLSNHLFWLANEKPGGHTKWEFMNDNILNESYTRILSNMKACDTIIAEISL